MTAPCEISLPGPAAGLATAMGALVPVIDTPRLRLRAPQLADFDAYAAIVCGPRGAHVGGPMTREEAWADFAQMVATWLLRGHGVWVVESRAVEGRAGTLLGFTLIGFEWGDAEPELGFLFLDHAEGQGYATEAALAARDHAFGRLGLPTLVSYIAPGNEPSARVAQRLGARRDGTLDGSDVWRHDPERTA